MKFLILGCNGMAGHTVSLYLKEQGHKVIGFARKKSCFVDTIIGNAEIESDIKQAIAREEFDCIVNCIGILNNDAERSKDKAVFLNAYLPHLLETIAVDIKTKIVHLSTDCVFSGRRGAYLKDDFRDSETFYGRSKALGEIDNKKDFTIRTSIIGPDMNKEGVGLFNWFMKQTSSIQGFSNVKWTGVTTLQLAKTIEKIVGEDWSGLHNLVPENYITKYELLMLINEIVRGSKINIIEKETPIADKSLIQDELSILLHIPSYREMIEELYEWILQHRNLYSHYGI